MCLFVAKPAENRSIITTTESHHSCTAHYKFLRNCVRPAGLNMVIYHLTAKTVDYLNTLAKLENNKYHLMPWFEFAGRLLAKSEISVK